jgi:hypothetical protein
MFVAGLMTFALVVMRWVISENSSGNLWRARPFRQLPLRAEITRFNVTRVTERPWAIG